MIPDIRREVRPIPIPARLKLEPSGNAVAAEADLNAGPVDAHESEADRPKKATLQVSVEEAPLLTLEDAVERVDPALRDAMRERLRAEFRQVVRWRAEPESADPVGVEEEDSEV